MRIQSWRLILSSIFVALLVIYFVWWSRMINNPDERDATDFMAFYAAGRVSQSHGFSSIYDIDLQQDVQEIIVGFKLVEGQVLLYNHLPYFVPILTLVVNEDYPGSFTRWVVFLAIIFLGATSYLVQSLFKDESTENRLMLAGGLISFTPLFVSLWQGQDTAFLYLGLVMWCVGMLKKQDLTAAAGLTLITVRPHLCIALALPLLFKHRQVLWRFVILAGLAGIYSLLLVGLKGIYDFIGLLAISAKGEWFGMNPGNMLNLLGLMLRGIRFINEQTINSLGWFLYLLGLACIVWIWLRSQVLNGKLLGLTLLITVIFVPHLHLHDLTILLFPLLFAVLDDGYRLAPQRILLVFGGSFVFIAGLVVEPLYFILPYLFFMALAWRLISSKHTEAKPSGVV